LLNDWEAELSGTAGEEEFEILSSSFTITSNNNNNNNLFNQRLTDRRLVYNGITQV